MDYTIVIILLIILFIYRKNVIKFIPRVLIDSFTRLFGGSKNGSYLPTCVRAHSHNGFNYPWLKNIHGGLDKITFEEPVGSNKWNEYTDMIWAIHCKVIDHGGDLVEAHMKAFVYTDTRFARLKFHFNNGHEMEPVREFYELEKKWFTHGKV